MALECVGKERAIPSILLVDCCVAGTCISGRLEEAGTLFTLARIHEQPWDRTSSGPASQRGANHPPSGNSSGEHERENWAEVHPRDVRQHETHPSGRACIITSWQILMFSLQCERHRPALTWLEKVPFCEDRFLLATCTTAWMGNGFPLGLT